MKNQLNPDFARLQIPLSKLCNGDHNIPIKLELWDFHDSNKHKFMGSISFSLAELQNNQFKYTMKNKD